MRIQIAPLSLAIIFLSVSIASAGDDTSDRIDFNRDVRPILSDRCFLCHGPDQSSELASETDLRLDDRESALSFGVFNLEEVDASELIARITSEDQALQMPPPDSRLKRMSDEEVEVLRRWIQQGAQYDKHWAYVPPVRPAVPTLDDADEISNPIDAFVLQRLEATELKPAPIADRETLIRRVTFDLTGLPPTIEEIDDFVDDPATLDIAYEKVVDRLLASPHYGEQMARYWLDAARYADTSGYQYDRERTQWVWRDWVIHAFNTNMPFDQFTIEQIAGDLLEDANDQTRLATGFNRNHPITIEGGVVDEEYRTEYVIDRVVTTSTVWLGQTLICARCHDHKYDPISQENFYQFYSFFNNVPERGLNGFDPKLTIESPINSRKVEIESKLAEQKAIFESMDLPFSNWEEQALNKATNWIVAAPKSVTSSGGATAKQLEDNSILMSGTNPATDDYTLEFQIDQQVTAIKLEAITDASLTNGSASRGSNGNFVLSEFVVEARSKDDENFSPVEIIDAEADYEQKNFTINLTFDGKVDKTGWAVDGNTKPENRTAVFSFKQSVPAGSSLRITLKHRYGLSHQIGRFRLSFSEHLPLDAKVEQILGTMSSERTEEDRFQLKLALANEYGESDIKKAVEQLETLSNELKDVQTFPPTLVMDELKTPRQAFVLMRGEYDKPIKDRPVSPAVPASIGTLPESAPANRLSLAKWLVARDQPLTARVTVNRYWQRLFGIGLVKTSEDFGAQGEYPSHPELLDWLAVEFMENGWNVKELQKSIVMSRTYRQSSKITELAQRLDPNNRMLSRGPRVRLDGEVIRDTALAVSGLLEPTIGGPSVYPYHPQGLWLEINNRPNFSRAYPHQTDSAQNHRRTLYTFWKRTVPPPSIATFDAPSREYCVVRRSSTNTPLQAFVLMHDPQFLEAARHLAARMLTEGGSETESQIAFGFRCCTGRKPSPEEQHVLMNSYEQQLERFQSEPAAAEQLLGVGVMPLEESLDSAELAAMTQVARMLMNLSEFLTKG